MRTTVRGTLSQFAAWLESGCLRSDGKRDFRGGNDSPSKALPGLEKDQKPLRPTGDALRPAACLLLVQLRGIWTCADPKNLLHLAFSELRWMPRGM
jgi:hypothetical protein